MDPQKNNPEKTKKLEIELDLDLFELVSDFCNLVNWSINKFVQKTLSDTMTFYKDALDEHTGVSQILWEDFFAEGILKKLAAIYKFKI